MSDGRRRATATTPRGERQRDERDAGRSAAPLKPAADAKILDTTDLDIEAAFRAALAIVEKKRG